MRLIATLFLLIIVAAAAWRVATIISPDAVSMAVGMLFGVLAGIPTALLMLASNRRRAHDDDDDYYSRRQWSQPPPPPPVIVLTTPQQNPQQIAPRYMKRHVRVIGDNDDDAELFNYKLSAYGNDDDIGEQ